MDHIFDLLHAHRNEQNAFFMEKYMKNKFPFLGIKTPERRALSVPFIKQEKQQGKINHNFINKAYSLPEREYQYVAIDYLIQLKHFLHASDLAMIKKLIMQKSWWDTTDALSTIVGYLSLTFADVKDEVVNTWSTDENLWIRRVSIIFQLQYKEATDTQAMFKIIRLNSNTNEFFINKAIGWALRQYSKTNKTWVNDFITQNKLSALSIKEGSKYI